MGTLAQLLPADSPVNDFLGAYNTVDAALDAAATVGVYLPTNVAAQVANAGLGLYGAPGTWYGAGAAQGWSAGGASGFLGGLGSFLGPASVIAMLPAIADMFDGGANDASKTGKWFGEIRNLASSGDAQGIQDKINNLITTGWRGETRTDYQYVMKPLLDSGIIDETYPMLWSKDSQYDLAKGQWSVGGWNDDGTPSNLIANPRTRNWHGDPHPRQAALAVGNIGFDLGDFNQRRDRLKAAYDQIKASGYTGDISKLENYINNGAFQIPEKPRVNFRTWRQLRDWENDRIAEIEMYTGQPYTGIRMDTSSPGSQRLSSHITEEMVKQAHDDNWSRWKEANLGTGV